LLELADGVKLCEHLQSEQGGLIDDEHHFELFSKDELLDLGFDEPDHDGAGGAVALDGQLS
jgi:hypothetical protein